MHIIDKISSLFSKKKTFIGTQICLYNFDNIKLPEFDDLSYSDKKKVSEYVNDINLKNVDSIVNYAENKLNECRFLTDLLVSILMELNEVIRTDDKTPSKLQEIDIDMSIKNEKVHLIKGILSRVRDDLILRTKAVDIFLNCLKNRDISYLNLPSRIRRESRVSSLTEAENRCLIAIDTIDKQIGASMNAINSNNIYKSKMDIYNSISNNKNSRYSILEKKYLYYCFLKYNLNINFSRFKNMNYWTLSNLFEFTEDIIIKDLAVADLELDIYLFKNKNKASSFIDEFSNLKNSLINDDNIKSIKSKAWDLVRNFKLYKKYIPSKYFNELYEFIFYLLTYDINKKKNSESWIKDLLFLKDYNDLHEFFIDIIKEKIGNLVTGNSSLCVMLKKNGKLKEVIKTLNKYYKNEKNEYDYEKILFDNSLLALLLAFDNKESLNKFFHELCIVPPYYVFEYMSKQFSWEKYVPLISIYCIYDIALKSAGKNDYMKVRMEAPVFYDIYNLCYDILHDRSSNCFYVPEGITQFHARVYRPFDDVIGPMSKEAYHKEIICPKSMDKVSFEKLVRTLRIKSWVPSYHPGD